MTERFLTMKKANKILSLLLAVVFLLAVFTGCQQKEPANSDDEAQNQEFIDYVAGLKLDMTTASLKQEVTVKTYIDGDTTHFYVPTSITDSGVLKARYLAVNTPESTGKIEEWGKAASNFTKNALKNAVSIIIESDDDKWNADSTGSRYLVWVWYKPSEDAEYRNLNLELLQEGYAIASSSANNRYGTTCMSAIAQAEAFKKPVYSKQPDPDFYYGPAHEITLKELRTNIEAYSNETVAFEGIISADNNNGVYVEEYDEETGIYFGIYVYYGFNLSGTGLEILSVGNRVRIVGSVQYYEAGGSYQVSGLKYRAMKPDDPENIQKLGEGFSGAYPVTDAARFMTGNVVIPDAEGEEQEYKYGDMVMSTTLTLENLQVVDTYTTTNDASSMKGAMTLTCKAGDTTVSVRTIVFVNSDGTLITEDAYAGKNITVKGVVDFYEGNYQILVLSPADITVND